MTTYVANVTLFDGHSVKRKQGVLIDGGVIGWVGEHARAPRAARTADEVPGADRTLAPGLIDCHVHLCFDGSADFFGEAQALTDVLAVVKSVRNAEREIRAGVTTVRDLGSWKGTACEVATAIERGLVPGPRVIPAGRALTITGGHGHNIGIAREVDGPDTVRRAVREEIRGGAGAIKLMATGGVLTPGIAADFTSFTPEELEAAVDEAHSWGRTVAAHAIGGPGIVQAATAGVDSIEHGSLMDAAGARLLKERGTFHVPTISAILGMVEHSDEVPAYAVEKAMSLAESAREAFRRSVRSGVRIALGTDAGTPFNPHGNAPSELERMVAWGLPPLRAWRAATSDAAELLRLPDIGTVEARKRADVVLYEGDPVDDLALLRSPTLVMRDGSVVAASPKA